MADSTPRARSKQQEKNVSKQKNRQHDWYECALCKRVVHTRDTTQHEEACKSGNKLEHGFIYNGVLHGVVSPNSVANNDTTRVPSSKRNELIYLHPSTIPPCHLATGFPCLVNNTHVLLAWPCDRLPPVSVVLPSLVMKNMEEMGQKVEEGTLVTVENIPTQGRASADVVEIELRSQGRGFSRTDFMEFLPLVLEGKYITEGSAHTVTHFGQDCTFIVKKIVRRHLQKDETSGTKASTDSCKNSGDIDLDLSSLNISDVSGDCSYSVTSPATPASTKNSSSPLPQIPDSLEKKSAQFSTPVFDNNRSRNASDFDRFVQVTSRTRFVINPLSSTPPSTQLSGGQYGAERVLQTSEESRERATEGSKVSVLDGIGGLDRQKQVLKELSRPLLQASEHQGAQSCGVLLYGPPGSGKTMLARALSEELRICTVDIPVHTVWSKIHGETERKLCSFFQTAKERSPSLILLDNLDALCPRPGAHQTDLEKRVATALLSLLDGILSRESATPCMVLGITNDPNSINPALRRPGRLDNEIQTAVPSPEERMQILKALMQNKPRRLTDVDIRNISDATHGFVGADLFGLVKAACIHAIKRFKGDNQQETPCLTPEDLLAVLQQVSPSSMKEMKLEVPKVHWSDIGGQTEVKEKLKQAVEWPLKHPEAFTRLGIPPPRGLLMYGPPGCSKTMVAKALATESGLNFLAVKGSELFSKYVGESEQAVRSVFQKARAATPSIIFFDEIDALAAERGRSGGSSDVADRVLTQLLTEMDGVEGLGRVYVVAATNRPDMIDKALLRPGRFDNILYVSLPDASTRQEILQIEFKKKPLAADVSLEKLVEKTEGYSGAELTAICNAAALLVLEEEITATEIRMDHFVDAMAEIQPGTSQELLRLYENFSHQPDLKTV